MPNRLALILLFSIAGFAQEAKSAFSRELVSEGVGIKVWRLTIAPHTSSHVIMHATDYVFVPLVEVEVMQSIRAGNDHNPLAGTAGISETSFVPRGSQILYVHPGENEPDGGQITYNPSDALYVALEIEIDEALPTLRPRASLLNSPENLGRKWQIGKYLLSIQALRPGEEVLKDGDNETLFPVGALTLGIGTENKPRSVNAGEAVKLGSASCQNITTFKANVLLLSRLRSDSMVVTADVRRFPSVVSDVRRD